MKKPLNIIIKEIKEKLDDANDFYEQYWDVYGDKSDLDEMLFQTEEAIALLIILKNEIENEIIIDNKLG